MIEIIKKEDCTGCHACYNVCPKECITMEHDVEGFLYPNINTKKCIGCNLCEKICPIIHQEKVDNNPLAYGCHNKNEEIRSQSTSGGIFTLIAEHVINSGGIVFGAEFDENYNVRHNSADDILGIEKFRGAKYVQSKIGDTYKQVKQLLKEDKMVLFTGTPCQIGGLKSYLKKDYCNLICQDIICHGVPSQYVWQHYKNLISKDRNIKKINFRDKSTGWKKYSLKLEFIGGRSYEEVGNENAYIKGFIKNLYLRPSCYECAYKTLNRQSDITLADFWGVEGILPNLDDNKGTSLIFINSDKGKFLFDKIKNDVVYENVHIEKSIVFNPCAIKSCIYNKKRDLFMDNYKDNNFTDFIYELTEDNPNSKLFIFIKKFMFEIKSITKIILYSSK
ncbi:Coenzyme F420 hydrogenase/dehydrogenase, beta subunit C-terminal domain [Terrisporobacter mayombei]|uniref:Ion-translocating oxidoreductase complex subunit B n=1 Tax=Terrisporobacter mayombei TaxID=1541 RepID=A0ABY9Q8N9_9FIRM|nr:Coenzyme F420 hydrogenase/dehydrogenase, beta subunit C-terminal domain [Terrisporobacter mayombei]MCC3869652.1 Coenzyme F420 hydrogenase/dehydrogenase, beta subunit C-terminal domain [Terrisporobacter mayombei]WMT83410.1 Ion-translocating oxidoreductase complex subunit B [Terrisporobacter mayombei]